MYYIVIKGKDKGKLFIEEETNNRTRMILANNGKVYRLDDVRELTEEEQKKYVKIEKII